MAREKGWYVIQVQTGHELAMCDLIERNLASDRGQAARELLDECFSPQFKTRRKYQGEWRDVTKLLLPGYIIAVTAMPAELALRLRRIPEFTRLLNMGETFVPLNDSERGWIDAFTKKGDRVVPMSLAVKDGDTIVVTEGPLRGHEGMIVRVNRRKCLAFLEFQIGGKRITSMVGLGILKKQEA